MLTVRYQTFWVSGSCPYGERCCFIHTELPNTTGARGPPPSGHERSPSSTTHPTETDSLLARLSARRTQHTDSGSLPAPDSSFQFGAQKVRLGIDTSEIDQNSMKVHEDSTFSERFSSWLDEKKHVCTACYKKFNRPSSLRIHMNTHTGSSREV